MIELLIVLAILAVASALVTWALPDGDASRLEEESERLIALLEMARAESRVSGVAVRWRPLSDSEPGLSDSGGVPSAFQFVGLTTTTALPTQWLDARITAEVSAGGSVLLGPEAILPPQQIVLRLGQRRLDLVTDGLAPFAVQRAGDVLQGQP